MLTFPWELNFFSAFSRGSYAGRYQISISPIKLALERYILTHGRKGNITYRLQTLVLGAVSQALAYAIQGPAPPFPLFALAYAFGGFGMSLQVSGKATRTHFTDARQDGTGNFLRFRAPDSCCYKNGRATGILW